MKPKADRLVTTQTLDAGESSRPVKLASILVAIDFSKFSKRALDCALVFAEKLNAKITLRSGRAFPSQCCRW
jgi:hypothetical protein